MKDPVSLVGDCAGLLLPGGGEMTQPSALLLSL